MGTRKEDLDEILEALSYGTFDENDEADFYPVVVQPFSEKYKKPFDYATGATKGVLIFEQLGFVIKIPFCRNSEDYDDYYECCNYFTGADADNGWDYCEAEADKYQRAEEEGISMCFAKTEKIGEIDGYFLIVHICRWTWPVPFRHECAGRRNRTPGRWSHEDCAGKNYE